MPASQNRQGLVSHHYGPQVILLDHPFVTHLLAKLGHPHTVHPQMSWLMKRIYQVLCEQMMNLCFPLKSESVDTRMKEFHPQKGIWQGQVFEKNQKVIVTSVVRAGTVPGQICFDELCQVINPSQVRQDFFFCSRQTNDKNEVVGTKISGQKCLDDVDGAYIILPDPMGATGSSLCEVVKYYHNKGQGKIKKVLALHMIITPEYIRRVKQEFPDMIIIAGRLDRGLSSQKALSEIPGTIIDEEKGLDPRHYIVPGAGGVGEVMNNCFV